MAWHLRQSMSLVMDESCWDLDARSLASHSLALDVLAIHLAARWNHIVPQPQR